MHRRAGAPQQSSKSLLPLIDHVSILEVGKATARFAELKRLVIIIRYMGPHYFTERNKLKHYFTERNGTYKNKWLLMGARDKFETFKNIGTMNADLVDSFQMAKCVLISIPALVNN